MRVPAALVMQVEPPNIKVFVSSESRGNPYEHGELASLNTGLYCETVMKTRQPLLVPDALVDEEWKSNPDIKSGMISYMGFPIAWPDGEIFGTICVLDNKRNDYSDLYRKLLMQCRDVLQADLKTAPLDQLRNTMVHSMSAAQILMCERLKQLGFSRDNQIKLYGSQFELVGDPLVIRDDVVFVDAVERNSGRSCRTRIALNILRMATEKASQRYCA